MTSPNRNRPAGSLRQALAARTVIADGAMGTMLQAADPTLEDFQGHEGCNEILNVSRPDIVRSVHDKYLAAGVDAIETNTFGANWANLAEYGIEDRIYELAYAGAKIAREAADAASTVDKPRFVLGSLGPGTKLPSLGHTTYQKLKEAYYTAAKGLLDAKSDALLVETTQDLLQAKAAVNGCRQAIAEADFDVVLIAQVTVETTGTMLLGSEIGAALNALEPLEIDLIGLNCATGPAEMSEHLRYLSKFANCAISVMPNAGLPILGAHGAEYPLGPTELADALETFVGDYGIALIGGCCGTTPEHLAAVVEKMSGKPFKNRGAALDPGASSLYQYVPFRQDNTYLAIGEKTNANGSRAFRDALVAEDWEKCVEIARDQIRDGAHMLDLSVDYVGRDGARDMYEIASRFATASTLPIVLDSTEPNVLKAGLEALGGRSVINSVNYEDGDGPTSRFARIMPLVQEHGAAVVALTIDEEGQARTSEWKLRVARRLIEDLTGNWQMKTGDILIDCLTFPIATGQEETRRDGIETIDAIRTLKSEYPEVQTTLGVSNVSFGLNPAARVVLNSVFLHECVAAGLDSAIVHPSKITPLARIEERHKEVALDLIYDRRRYEGETCIYDPLTEFLQLFEGVELAASRNVRASELAALPLTERLQRRIIDGEKVGLSDDLDTAMQDGIKPLAIINDYLLEGMKVVGELFGKGEMQLPFVLQSAEVMKTAVAYLEPHMEKTDDEGRGTMLLATVKGDVHDIGKNLVDIILSNNGYTVVNIGIKQTINQIIDAAQESNADAIGMSGLLVKSTVIMKENLEELTNRGLAEKWPVVLGGAALTRAFVEQDLAAMFPGEVRYARDAFEGLRLMDSIMAVKRGVPGAELPALRERKVPLRPKKDEDRVIDTKRSDVAVDIDIPSAPFFGSRIIKGVPLADYVGMLDERALFVGQWGLKGARGEYESMVESEGRPRLRALLNQVQSKGWLNAAVVYGYFPCVSEGNDLVILHHEGPDKGKERTRFSFPRQSRDRRLCLSDFFAAKDSGKTDVVAFHVVTMGSEISKAANELFAANNYREYLELHGLSVQLTEALAEHWHARVREEFSVRGDDAPDLQGILDQGYRGSRYSFGYPACPDIEQQVQLCELLEPGRIGVELSEEFQLHPEQSTSAIIVHHPEAKYFNAN
ncbi:MAG: methionine synthase [Actinobacteria bacterium]|uniref:methionine synthase n=1 Tax=freshwater metagenome TaxID=449393 RepID=A0A6J7K975_9ZZZZ|nr:methionine synthase [Actinomycetota bacterium]MTA91074.1 methionine synthase [Actinomycetota bacterium]